MKQMSRRSALVRFAVIGFAITSAPLYAAPRSYVLDGAASTVGFIWKLGEDPVEGEMPVTSADLTIDLADVRHSSVTVELDATNVRAGFIFATQALKGPKMLDTDNYPHIRFQSTSVQKSGDGAQIDGLITIRGITRPFGLHARLFRPAGSDPDDFDQLQIILNGKISRKEFGATGWSDLVADDVELNINAHIRATS